MAVSKAREGGKHAVDVADPLSMSLCVLHLWNCKTKPMHCIEASNYYVPIHISGDKNPLINAESARANYTSLQSVKHVSISTFQSFSFPFSIVLQKVPSSENWQKKKRGHRGSGQKEKKRYPSK